MTLTATEQHVGTRVEDALRSRFAERSAVAAAHGADFAALWDLAAAHVLGGKLIRPRLLLNVHRAMTGDRADAGPAREDAALIDLAASIELLHYAFLLHDDVIDGDLVRRRRPNLIGTIAHARSDAPDDAELHWARTCAILMGDLLLSTAVLGFARADVDPRTRARLLDLVEHVVVDTVAGEHADVGLSDGMIRPDLATVLAMTVSKTASYSFSLPLRAAAILAGATETVEAGMTAIGRHLGLAYQLQDDLLCMFGDPDRHGKDPFSDLREGKETVIIAFARQTGHWPRIAPVFGMRRLTPEDAAAAREHLRDCGAERFTRSLVDEQLAAASAVLADLMSTGAVSVAVGAAVEEIALRIEGRTS